jgi:hypothetical protein
MERSPSRLDGIKAQRHKDIGPIGVLPVTVLMAAAVRAPAGASQRAGGRRRRRRGPMSRA